jgi:4a-hydroxytetrahydrobiopterin dehydratase
LNKAPENWVVEANALKRDYAFANFAQAMAFMQACQIAINKINHHPEWCNIYNKVSVTLRTHDAGNTITAKDFALAYAMEEVFINL